MKPPEYKDDYDQRIEHAEQQVGRLLTKYEEETDPTQKVILFDKAVKWDIELSILHIERDTFRKLRDCNEHQSCDRQIPE